MTLRDRGNPGSLSRVGAPIMAAAMRRANRKDLASLKRLLEAIAFLYELAGFDGCPGDIDGRRQRPKSQ